MSDPPAHPQLKHLSLSPSPPRPPFLYLLCPPFLCVRCALCVLVFMVVWSRAACVSGSRAKKRMQYNRRFVNVVTGVGGKRLGPNSNAAKV